VPIPIEEARRLLLADLNDEQAQAVSSGGRQLLVVAGAGSGKTEVMSRRVGWMVAVEGVAKEAIVAFTFTEAAASELKFRIRFLFEQLRVDGENASLGGMYVGTIHGFCLKALRELASDQYYIFDVLDDAGRISLITQGYHGVLGLNAFRTAAEGAGVATGQFASIELFLHGYDLLNEYDQLSVVVPGSPPNDVREEREWCLEAVCNTNVGDSELAEAFRNSAARYYAYLRARRFFDFSTVQSELMRKLREDGIFRDRFRGQWSHLVVDEVQDINPVQFALIQTLVGDGVHLTAVGDHRQAIYQFRGGRVDLMGQLAQQINEAEDGVIVELPNNYRSTSRIIEIANRWSDTIRDTSGMTNPHMVHGRVGRDDYADRHVAVTRFNSRDDEARWIAATIGALRRNPVQAGEGAAHDERDTVRGLTLSDVAILVRSATDIRTYQDALREAGIPAIVRGGPDLFSQPEVLLCLSVLARCGGIDEFYGADWDQRALPSRIQSLLGHIPTNPDSVIPAALNMLRDRGLHVADDTAARLVLLSNAIRHRLASAEPQPASLAPLRCLEARIWLNRNREHRRVFPQAFFHWILHEVGVQHWDQEEGDADVAAAARFHLGQLSSLVMGVVTPGRTPPRSFRWHVIALLSWGSKSARTPEAPLLVSPDAVSITTIHSAKGLQFPAVFLADVNARRFPSSRARTVDPVPFDDVLQEVINPQHLADNEYNDNERRLMYVALTRAERYLFITSNSAQQSRFLRDLQPLVRAAGGTVTDVGAGVELAPTLEYHPRAFSREDRLATSFSDLRYYLECPHDFYLRIVLGYAPTIGQEFGYGRGVHNLLRIVHDNPRYWADLANNGEGDALEREIRQLVNDGVFYLRYTTGAPLENLRERAVEGVAAYVRRYADAELARLDFLPEKEFEALIDNENILISGAIDLVRLDDPPQVTVVDFKSGNSANDNGSGLTRELMAMQIGVYGLAAREELEYEPQQGLVRYIGERDPARSQTVVELSDEELARVREEVIRTGRSIQAREFDAGPTGMVENRCASCDHLLFCSRQEADDERLGRRR